MAKIKFRKGASFEEYCPFPVGTCLFCLYDPNEVWPGTTWHKHGEGHYLVSAGDTYKANSTYGSNTHTLTVEEMPRHTHYPPVAAVWGGDAGTHRNIATTNSPLWSNGDENNAVTPTGNGAAHNNMPQSIAVPLWVRTK